MLYIYIFLHIFYTLSKRVFSGMQNIIL